MKLSPFRRFARNLSTLFLAFILAVVVWVSAVVTADPNEERTYKPVPIELRGLGEDMLLVSDIQSQVNITLIAPSSIWERLNTQPELLQAWIDLTGLGSGEHTIPVQTLVDISPFRYVQIDPEIIYLTLEKFVSERFPVELVINGEPPLGYQKGSVLSEPMEVTVSGPQSIVERVVEARTSLEISGSTETVRRTMPVEVLDANENVVLGLTVVPKSVMVTQPISLLGGFKNVVVKVMSVGQVDNGYRLTNITVSPPNVTLFSDNPLLLSELPGFVDTMPVDLTGLSDDMELNVGLNLPDDVELVREHSVLVQVSVAAIQGSLTFTLPVEVVGLSPDLEASVAPLTVDVIIAGPLRILETLTPTDYRVVLDLSGLPPGVYQRTPVIEELPAEVRVQTTLPEAIEVTISLAPTPTPTVTPTPGPSPTLTVTPTLTSTLTLTTTLTPELTATITPQP
ncbi:YbbR-like domain-containing protein [Chloroflexota bacterium]